MRPIAALYASIIQFYERFAPYPFSQYGGLDSETYGGGAMEAYSYATYGGGLPSEDPHEPAHTWWGGLINNTYFHSFW
ncbi:M1 family metallopeptidase, partial [Pseudomonas sp. GW460-E13]|uniref:M1 family metallopeptidase n=1 Tax=Pseudomonas sp. GW460-E13 TaxID=2070611 RepID=UPI0011AEDB74